MDTATVHHHLARAEVSLPLQIHPQREPVCTTPATIYANRLKRVFDVVGALVLTALLLSWITPVLWVLIRAGSRGPLFFVQQRSGLNGKVFSVFKFRSMRPIELSDTLQAKADDARITRIGRFLRGSHIDELPQLLNVLMNDMSLVGPRPHMIPHDQLFSALVPGYRLRHLVKPGITGLAQAAGYHGATPDFFSISNRTRLDLFYVKRVSFQLDLKILLRTIFIVPVKSIKRVHGDGN